jgi:hypothetical protein
MSQTIPDIDPATLANMLHATVAALPVDPDASAEDLDAQRQAALLAVTALCPRDPVEAMLAARIVSAHHAAMECFRRAARHDIDDNSALRLQGKAVSLANLAMRTLRELRKPGGAARVSGRGITAGRPRTAGRDRAGRLAAANPCCHRRPGCTARCTMCPGHRPRACQERSSAGGARRLIDTCGSSTAGCAMPLFCQCCADAHMIRLARISIARF